MARKKKARKHPDFSGPPQVTRVPRWRPETWVVVRPAKSQWGDPGELAGKVRQVQSLSCSLREGEIRPRWRVHLGQGQSLPPSLIARQATEAEAQAARKRWAE